MCGRYTLHANKKSLADAIALPIPKDYKPSYNIGPGRETLSIATLEKVQVASTMMHWGLRTPQNFHINARIETADTAPRFREVGMHIVACFPQTDFTSGIKMASLSSPTISIHRKILCTTSLGSGFRRPATNRHPLLSF